MHNVEVSTLSNPKKNHPPKISRHRHRHRHRQKYERHKNKFVSGPWRLSHWSFYRLCRGSVLLRCGEVAFKKSIYQHKLRPPLQAITFWRSMVSFLLCARSLPIAVEDVWPSMHTLCCVEYTEAKASVVSLLVCTCCELTKHVNSPARTAKNQAPGSQPPFAAESL